MWGLELLRHLPASTWAMWCAAGITLYFSGVAAGAVYQWHGIKSVGVETDLL